MGQEGSGNVGVAVGLAVGAIVQLGQALDGDQVFARLKGVFENRPCSSEADMSRGLAS